MNNSRRFLKLNTIFGLLYQIVVILSGLILPRLILISYGSETNGLVNSIQSLLNVITLMELGVGAVVQTSLYKPLAENNKEMISKIVFAAKRFFMFVGLAFVVLVIGICVAYPLYVRDKFDIFSTILLIIAISITLFSQYFFGIVNSLLVIADQKNYIINIIQIITLILNTAFCAVLMLNGFSIQIVKFSTSLIFLARPIFLYFYVKKNYDIYKVQLNGDELPQKWNGVAQHIASYVLENTDIIVLTIFASLSSVSIYSTYYMVVYSIRLLIISLTNGIQSYYGHLYAIEGNEQLKADFDRFHYIINSLSCVVFSITCVMIVPFVMCYTSGVTDTNYNQFLFGVLLTVSQFVFCLRRSYNILVLAVGHYKETQWSAIIEAIINIVISIIFVMFFDLIGVAIGTLVAMLYRTIYYSIYFSKRIINRKIIKQLYDFAFDALIFTIAILAGLYINKHIIIANYWEWILYSCVVSLSIIILFTILSLILNRKNFFDMIKIIKRKVLKR